jgi:hypothetical protein
MAMLGLCVTSEVHKATGAIVAGNAFMTLGTTRRSYGDEEGQNANANTGEEAKLRGSACSYKEV